MLHQLSVWIVVVALWLVLSSANAVNSRKPFRNSMWNERCTNERQSRDSNRNAIVPSMGSMNAGPMRTNFCVLGGDMTANKRW